MFVLPEDHINELNTFSVDYVHASSVNVFENKVDKYLTKTVYT